MNDLLSFLDRPKLFVVCAVAAIPAYIAAGSVFYDSWEDFLDSLRLWFQPWWLSALRGEWSDDYWQSLKLLFYLFMCIALATTAYKVAQHFF
jgi:hypothetical protein